MTRSFAVLLFIVFSGHSAAAYEACTEIKSDVDRLACFDAWAAADKSATRTPHAIATEIQGYFPMDRETTERGQGNGWHIEYLISGCQLGVISVGTNNSTGSGAGHSAGFELNVSGVLLTEVEEIQFVDAVFNGSQAVNIAYRMEEGRYATVTTAESQFNDLEGFRMVTEAITAGGFWKRIKNPSHPVWNTVPKPASEKASEGSIVMSVEAVMTGQHVTELESLFAELFESCQAL